MRQTEKCHSASSVAAQVGKAAGVSEQAEAGGSYSVRCFGKDGNLKWQDKIENLVTTDGKNDALDKYLAGSGYTANFYLGLIGLTGFTTGVAVADTSASHVGWAEDENYSEGTRLAPSWNAAAAGAKATNAVSFSINALVTIKGCFLITNSTKGGATGILYSAGLFSGGDKSVDSGDTLNVTYSATL